MKIGTRSRFFSILFASVVICPMALASWSDDPAVNLAVADRSGEQTQAKQVTRSDDKIYLSWFDNSAGGYDVYLQLLDTDGTELWPHNGVLVADRSFSSTQDYDLAIDTSGNALLAFRDDRGTGVNITAAAVDPDGNLLWGTSGVQLANGTDFVAAPKIAGTTDGSAVVAWTNESDVIVQKLDGAGTPLWSAGVSLSDDAGGNFTASDLNASNDGSAIVAMVRQTNFSSPKHLYAQKLSTSGAFLWGASPVIVFDGGSLQFGNFPTFVEYGGGGVFAWYDTAAGLQCFVQRILSSGTERFPHNGVAVSTAPRDRVSPVVTLDQFGNTYVFWREQQPGPFPEDGVYGQRIGSDGTRLWGDEGLAVTPLATDELTQIRAVIYPNDDPEGGDMLVSWVQALAFDNDRILATRIDSSGNAVWATAQTTVASSVSGKSRLFAQAHAPNSGNAHGWYTLSWSDNRNDANDVYVQNINGDGSLGVDLVDTDLDGVADAVDNCTLFVNADQRDTDGDAIGNACDADVNGPGGVQDCIVNFLDLLIYRQNFFQMGDFDTDNNGDNITSFLDLLIVRLQFFGSPGPSAAGCDTLP